jgi:segregation and condensation protein B
MNENELETDILNEDEQQLMDSEGLHEEIETPEEEQIPSELEPIQARSIIESILLASDKPLGLASFKEVFKGTNIKTPQIREALESLSIEYAGAERGVSLLEVGGGYQLRTKPENSPFVRRMMKGRPFKLSGPALEVLAIISYKQPIIKAEVDEIRGVESGHLMRALMDRGLIKFDGKSELPGKPMLYGTTRKFLEIFGLRDIRELPSLNEIDQLMPEGIGADESEKEQQLGDMQAMGLQYQPDPDREVEWEKISTDLAGINTSTDFFEQEKVRQREERDRSRAEDIRTKILLGDAVEDKDKKWLSRYEAKSAAPAASAEGTPAETGTEVTTVEANAEAAEAHIGPAEETGTAANELDAALEMSQEAASTEEEVAEETYPLDTDAIATEVADPSKLGEILEGLKAKNASRSDTASSEREHLKQSVYRPDQLAKALKDFESDED